ncbi:MAG: hypothetical protein CMI54_04970 [Parcubacteria group bacterium]|nr:hypothetical protein [Parcubacteria group bacterium]|tara:strand:+ start:922 stop:1785 length:864 start_codon:yes stop_codon:yes gene_type:complete
MLRNILIILAFSLALGITILYQNDTHQTFTFAPIAKKQTNQPIFPTPSFVKIEKVTKIHVCQKRKKKKKRAITCIEGEYKVLASGFVVAGEKEGSYIMSAAHACHDEDEIKKVDLQEHINLLGSKISIEAISIDIYAYDINNTKHKIEIIDLFGAYDLCFLYSESLNTSPIFPSNTDASVGDKVYNLAAPAGFHFANVVPILDGYCSGFIRGHSVVYTVPSTGGSSGSPILNKNGEYVGMAVATIDAFKQITISPKRKNITKFISYILQNKTCGELHHISPHFDNYL